MKRLTFKEYAARRRAQIMAHDPDDLLYECQCCGARFSDPAYHREAREFWGRGTWEDVSGCPRCGGSYIQLGGYQ